MGKEGLAVSADAGIRLTEIMLAPILAQAVASVTELGIPDLIDGKRSVPELASEAGCDERTLYRTLRFLAGHGIFEEREDRRFALTPLGSALRTDADHSYRAAARMFGRLLPTLGEFPHSLRTGESALTRHFGASLFEYLSTRPEDAAIFDAAMTAIHDGETPAMLNAYDFSGITTLADIGGGNGSLLRAVLQKHPDLRGLLFDLDHVVDRARDRLRAAGLEERCRTETGSFFEAIPTGADTYLMRHIIHDWSDEQSVRILENCRRAMPADGRLLLVEAVVPPGNEPSPAKDMDITMLVFPGGIERTEAEYRELLAAAGFQLTRVTPTASPVSVIEGRPA